LWLNIRPNDSAATRGAGFVAFPNAILGLTPQALCWRPLRGLKRRTEKRVMVTTS